MKRMLAVLVALIAFAAIGYGIAAAVTSTTSVTGPNLQCSQDTSTATNCTSTYTLGAGHAITVKAKADPPKAAFTITPNPAIAGQPTTFDASSSTCNATPCTYAWTDPVDGQSYSTAKSFSYTFNSLSTHQMKLVITDAVGQTDSLTTSFDVVAGTTTTTTTTSTSTTQTRNCAGANLSGNPSYASMDACGFPSPNTTGVPAGTTLTSSGGFTAASPGQVISGLRVTGSITVTASNVTIENSDISTNSSNGGIRIGSGVTGTIVKNDTIHGTDATSAGNLQAAVYNTNYTDSANAVTIDHVEFYNGQRIMHGPGTLKDSFCLDNVAVSGAHYECVYEGGGGVTIDHNTLLTAFSQTAAVFLSSDFAPLGNVYVTNNLLAGGGYALYGDATNIGSGIASETVTGNHFSRLYYSNCGYWGTDAYMPSAYTWSGNVWDDTGVSVTP